MNNEEHSPDSPENTPPKKTKKFRRPSVFIISAIILAFVIFWSAGFLVNSFTHEGTDDAFLDNHFVSIAAKVAGWVTSVNVQDNQFVQQGDLLLEIDPRDFEAKLAQKKAAAAASEANAQATLASYKLVTTKVQTAIAIARQSQAEANASKATADRAAADLKRNQDLRQRNVISPQEFDTVKAAAETAEANYKAAQEKAASDQSKIDEARAQLVAAKPMVEMAEAQSRQAQADEKLAALDVSYTKVISPVAGRVTTKTVVHGNYVQIGQNLLAIVPTNIWVTANFKETQLKKIRPGQPVEIEIDSVEGKKFRGHVDSIQSGSGARFSLLPPENAVGNYVKVVQRVPVKIVFDEFPQTPHVLGPGLSVSPSVRTSDFSISEIVLVIGSIILAAIVAILAWWMTRPKNETA